mgnify:CR=1 FL=1
MTFLRPRIGLFVLASILTATSCDDESSSGGGFSSYSFSGTLAGDKTGTFKYTVSDSYGNTDGTAEILGRTITLRGSVSGGKVMLQFQNDSQYSGAINGTESGDTMSGDWYLSGSALNKMTQNYKGTATASRVSSGSSGGCSSLEGTWTSTDGYHEWNFSGTTAVLTTKSSDTPGAKQITYVNYTDSGSKITYYITRAKMTGSGGSDYDNTVDPPKGPYTEAYTLDSCKFTIGGKTYTR